MHKEKHAATHEFSEYTERENDEKGPCKHNAKQLSEYMEREKTKEWSCMQAEHKWCEKYMEREKEEKHIDAYIHAEISHGLAESN